MNTSDHFRSLSLEIDALKNRVRNLIDYAHWPTDGEWKESVLRTILRRYLPADIGVGRGFVITPDACTGQIDVLLYDTSKPILYRDGDLVIVTPDAIKGIVEVKTSMPSAADVFDRLMDNVAFIRDAIRPTGGEALQNLMGFGNNSNTRQEIFAGLFCYEWDYSPRKTQTLLTALQESAQGNQDRTIDYLSIGDSLFIHYWRYFKEPPADALIQNDLWHAYHTDRLARGYFVHNIVASVAQSSVDRNKPLWFPPEGKEFSKVASISLHS